MFFKSSSLSRIAANKSDIGAMWYFSVLGVTNAFLVSHALQTHSKILLLKKRISSAFAMQMWGEALL
jgi:hypothetical protein